MSVVQALFGKLPSFKDVHRSTYRFIRYSVPMNRVIAWHIKESEFGPGQSGSAQAKWVDPMDISQEVLQTLGVWDKIDKSIKLVMTQAKAILQKEMDDNMKNARSCRKRNPAYKGLPRDIPCSNDGCSSVDYIPPSILMKKVGLDGLDGDARIKVLGDFLGAYECAKCKPRRRGKAPNLDNIGFPKTATCIVCSKSVNIVPANIREKSAKMGVTVDELLADYKCRSCGGVMRGPNRKKREKREKREKKEKSKGVQA